MVYDMTNDDHFKLFNARMIAMEKKQRQERRNMDKLLKDVKFLSCQVDYGVIYKGWGG